MSMALQVECHAPAVSTRSTRRDPVEMPAVIMLDAWGRTLFSTPAARTLCSRFEIGFTATPGGISAVVQGSLAAGASPRAGMSRLVSTPDVEVMITSCMDSRLVAGVNAPHYMVVLSLRAPKETDSWLQQLTPSERRIAHLVGQGLRNKQIADALSISNRTVECHMNTIFQKLGLSSRAQLVRRLVLTAEN
ncbi:response regulator transcription factor [Steroidobacter sp.]|uniref:response regulator transcription factor n=1 Tax=Steroidobacter sp. TaxID=1978227 RepID=UPI001A40624C|nr:helix-turn-helix transcriptional regulator [Steroidobacter sp.]MBL8265440.1 helix-turn-helix transcriptional regulator [Steroidobacter sp.]